MKAINHNGNIIIGIPRFWNNQQNYNTLDESIHIADGWKLITYPTIGENQRSGDIYERENDFTYHVINFTPEEIRQNILRQAENQRQERISNMTVAIQESQIMEPFQAITDDAEALENQEIYPIWENIPDGFEFPGSPPYKVQDIVGTELILFRIIQPHTKQSDRKPENTSALWTKIEFSSGVELWSQPTGGDGKYPYKDPNTDQPYVVMHNDQLWENNHPAPSLNVWEPGVFGWILINQ